MAVSSDDNGRVVASILALLMVLAVPPAMAAGDHAGGHGDDEASAHADDGHGHGNDFGFGEAAPDASPDRTVEIVAHDTMRYEPEQVTVKAGQVVRFLVHNEGKLQHSFTLGSPQYQRNHEREMQGMPLEELAGHMEGNPNGMVVQPGETGRLQWRFEADGPVQFACHIPGHFDAGMKGRLRIR